MRRLALSLTLLSSLLVTPAALAHPHVYVTARSEMLYRDDGAIVGIRYAWAFDDLFSTYALQGIAQKTLGTYTRGELSHLAQLNVEALKEHGYFTFAKAANDESSNNERFADPVDYFFEYNDGSLVLHFTLPFSSAIKTKSLSIEIYDPTYFVDFGLDLNDPVKLVSAPAGCTMTFQRAADGSANALALGETAFTSGANAGYGRMFANKIRLTCP
jgi:ABC-type uncharacterized transport system substrate-binding protein